MRSEGEAAAAPKTVVQVVVPARADSEVEPALAREGPPATAYYYAPSTASDADKRQEVSTGDESGSDNENVVVAGSIFAGSLLGVGAPSVTPRLPPALPLDPTDAIESSILEEAFEEAWNEAAFEEAVHEAIDDSLHEAFEAAFDATFDDEVALGTSSTPQTNDESRQMAQAQMGWLEEQEALEHQKDDPNLKV